MKNYWIEKGTGFNSKDYEFSISNEEYPDVVEISCKYGNDTTSVVLSNYADLYDVYNILNEMKAVLYRKNYR